MEGMLLHKEKDVTCDSLLKGRDITIRTAEREKNIQVMGTLKS